MTTVRKIISGGQTGADRAGLAFAWANHIPIGGWCPKGRRAEDGVVPTCYQLQEHPDAAYQPRTIENIKESDLTVVFARSPVSPGSRFTLNQCRRYAKKHLWLANFPDAEADARCLSRSRSAFDGVLHRRQPRANARAFTNTCCGFCGSPSCSRLRSENRIRHDSTASGGLHENQLGTKSCELARIKVDAANEEETL
jgi:hypothetical protein